MNDRSAGGRARLAVAFVMVAACAGPAVASEAELFDGPHVLEGAAIHEDRIVFGCGGKLWSVNAGGGVAEPITRTAAHDSLPCFSPDGARLAFLRRTERVFDVYLQVLATGQEQRLTYHPARDFPVGWSVDSRHVLLASDREGSPRLFTLDPDQPLPAPLPLPEAYVGSFSPDGSRIAYLPRTSLMYQFNEFRYYRGGECSPLWLVELSTGELERITDDTANARDPMWIGERVYFLWDVGGRFDLYVYDLAANETRRLTQFTEFGARSAASDGKSIVLVVGGGLQVFDIADETLRTVNLQVPRDPQVVRFRIVNAVTQVQSFSLNADGKLALVCARGDAFVVDTASGAAKNVTQTSGIAEREGMLSPDGRKLAYFSDASGEYALHIRDLGRASELKIPIEPKPSHYGELRWSPDGTCLAFSDKRLAVWIAEPAHRQVTRIDASSSSAQHTFFLNWSPDSRYLAYTKYDDNRLPGVWVHDRQTDTNHAVTRSDCHATCGVFDASGRWLYFVSSPNAPSADFGWGVLSGILSQAVVVRHLNAVALHRDQPAPVLGKTANLMVPWKEPPPPGGIDFEGIVDRIVPIDVSPLTPVELVAGPPGIVYLLVEEWPPTPGAGEEPSRTLYRLNVRAPAEAKKVLPFVAKCAVSDNGKTLVCVDVDRRAGGPTNWRFVTFEGAKASAQPLSFSALPAPVEPASEWKQIVHEAWRMMRDVFYDPGLHGLDWAGVEQHYLEFLPGVSSREELNVLLRRMLGHISVSHLRVNGGDIPPSLNEAERVGMLGADLELSDGLYRFKRVLRSGHFDLADPLVQAPLAQPGSEVHEGEYLLAINDKPLDARQNIFAEMRGTAGQPIQLLVAPSPDRSEARQLTVIPLPSESALRQAAWGEANRQQVENLSQGRLGYFHVPNYGLAGVQTFLRGYFANRSKEGLVIDQRYNGGGITPDYFVELLQRRPIYYYMFREGDDLAVPVNARTSGATVLLINDENGSAAETFALMFKLGKVGPLVGERTSGGVIGPYRGGFITQLIDGGRVQIPSRAAYNPAGSWDAENQGVVPDVAVEVTPQDWRSGRDVQLEAAVKAGLEAASAEQVVPPKRPPFPVHP